MGCSHAMEDKRSLRTRLRDARARRSPADVEAAAVALAERVLAPALAVDRRGNRLGRGAGYYDRALAAVSHDRVIAVVFEDEVLDSLPADAYDVPVATALTPSGLVSLSGD